MKKKCKPLAVLSVYFSVKTNIFSSCSLNYGPFINNVSISTRCIHFMPNLIKKSVTVSNLHTWAVTKLIERYENAKCLKPHNSETGAWKKCSACRLSKPTCKWVQQNMASKGVFCYEKKIEGTGFIIIFHVSCSFPLESSSFFFLFCTMGLKPFLKEDWFFKLVLQFLTYRKIMSFLIIKRPLWCC